MQHKRKQETSRRQINRLLGGVVRAKDRRKSRKKKGR